MPLWLVYAILALWPVVCVIRGPMRRAVRMMRGQCESCGYSLRLCPSDCCPECGSPVNPAGIETLGEITAGDAERT
jgi:rRNA maturation endonuclease Nob1